MASGFANDVCVCKNFNTADDGTKDGKFVADGQMFIGSTAAPNVRVGTIAAASPRMAVTPGPGTLTIDAVEAAFNLNNLGGTLGAAKGGTGRTTFPQGSILLGELTNPLNSVSLLDNQILVGVAAATDPVPITLTSGMQSYDTATGLMTGRTITGTAAQIAVTNGSGTAGNPTIALASQLSGLSFAYTAPGAYPYDVLVTDHIISVDTSVARTIRLPNAPTTGALWIVKDRVGSAGANNISVTTVGGAVNIDGSTTYTINVNYGSATFVFNGTTYEVI